MPIRSFHEVGVEVPVVLQISPQMFFNVTPTVTFNRVNKIFCIGFCFNSIFEVFLGCFTDKGTDSGDENPA